MGRFRRTLPLMSNPPTPPSMILLAGVMTSLVGGALTAFGFAAEAVPVWLAGYVVAAAGGCVLFVGLVAMGVSIGVAHADR